LPDDEGKEQLRLDSGAMIMASDLIDWTIPAHDPNFPKPRGLLPVPPEVAESVARRDAQLLRERGIQVTAEARQHSLDYATLNWYFDNTEVLYRRTPQGIEVVAAGPEEVSRYLREHPAETRRDVVLGVG
jgi:hypothetical protein